MPWILRIPVSILYEKMERQQPNRWVKNGSKSRRLLPWVLLALFPSYDRIRVDEHHMDGVVCVHHICRKKLVKGNIRCEGSWICICVCWHPLNNRNNVN